MAHRTLALRSWKGGQGRGTGALGLASVLTMMMYQLFTTVSSNKVTVERGQTERSWSDPVLQVSVKASFHLFWAPCAAQQSSHACLALASGRASATGSPATLATMAGLSLEGRILYTPAAKDRPRLAGLGENSTKTVLCAGLGSPGAPLPVETLTGRTTSLYLQAYLWN